uniref:Protein kinase domain-containing protein n=1 Tax=Pectinophora gossypiella TaxID=13191 RepID=A0A1E1WNQ7_PECGO
MRRTYKSKKETGSGLDHRDVLFNMDEKSSAFDAFYISNIKQTKREQSCMGSSNNYGVASNKVRKRKYVKRIVKEVEPPPRESLSESVFLTPDKSIRVNRAPDLFDQLLNSSPAVSVTKQPKKEDLFDKLLAGTPKERKKTYTRKKPTMKKFHYSTNESSESDKENSKKGENSIQNSTDIKSYELIIEKQATPNVKVDESINNIVKKLSLINNLNRNSIGSIKKTFKCNKNRLTRNVQSPSVKTSPLCSTPFIEKYRGKSIYRFSPIPMGDLEESPNYVTVVEDDEANKSIVFVPKHNNNALKRSQNEDMTSPVTHLQVDNFPKHTGSSSKSLFSSVEGHSNDNVELGKENPTSKSCEDKELPNIQISSLQVSETEPFLGFSNETVDKVNNLEFEIGEERDNSIILSKTNISQHRQNIKAFEGKHEVNSSISQDYMNNIEINESSIEYSVPPQPFIGFTKEANNKCDTMNLVVVDNTMPSEPFLGFTEVENNNSFNINKKDLVQNASVSSNHQEDLIESENIDSDQQENTDNVSQEFTDDDRQSLYDTCCNSDTSLNGENKAKEPKVALERMHQSLFQKYFEKMADFDSDDEQVVVEEENEISSGYYASFNNSDESSEQNDPNSSQSSNIEQNNTSSEDLSSENSSFNNNEITIQERSRKSTDEDRCISFVTTRRRNEFTNNSTILVLDDSQDSANSTDCDKTVLSNNDDNLVHSSKHVVNKDCIDFNIDEDVKLVDKNKSPVKIESKQEDNTVSNITTRDSRLFSGSETHNNSNESGINTGIILQPGKKWERSLSIYRRMTTMNDHFDQSILEEEDMHTKGRKYRQSVIETMEMQDHKGLLHNESNHNRRSTFVSKPSRSTIRILKETNNSRISLSSTTVFDDLKGFLEDCDDTIVELSKLSITEDPEVTVLDKFHESTRIATARDCVLRRCNQTDTLLFDECYPDTVLKNCRKIGEGVYGEVYLWRAPDGRARVMKIVPIAGLTKVNGEHQKDFHEIISEIVIAMELSALRAPIAEIECHLDEGKDIEALDLHAVENATDVFNEVLAVRCVYGGYPSRLLDLWELYDECKGSENDNPAILPPDQQYIVLELANAGQDLESYQFNSAEQAYALFLQVQLVVLF